MIRPMIVEGHRYESPDGKSEVRVFRVETKSYGGVSGYREVCVELLRGKAFGMKRAHTGDRWGDTRAVFESSFRLWVGRRIGP